ncbi:2-oxoglutarate-Fe(II)-dependent oxygenase superfamily protein [Acinetobacter calcoaceticus]|uniref:2-oxoglutarate-Fe(II)-dependent oxygenase superfamily protein n=1 Tax=Acinetobacter calcoaceticus TaxID=471 RepID=A0A4R1XRR7_ACICA|nr:2-oxoglutarate-Fe(II)-dependent oxygenase superfamily protein [Acinetobacter calcoaceticus]
MLNGITENNFALPMIDLAQLSEGENHAAFYHNLRTISRDSGFFYLRGHDFSPADFAQIFANSQAFFALTAQQKQQIAMVNSAQFRGYSQVAAEYTQQKPDHREQIDIGAELEALALQADNPAYYRLQGPNQWPAALPDFKQQVLAYVDKARALSIELLRHFLIALEQPADALDELISEQTPAHLFKLIHYPASQAEQRQGVGAHKDSGILTLLIQDQVGGLQVKTENG